MLKQAFVGERRLNRKETERPKYLVTVHLFSSINIQYIELKLNQSIVFHKSNKYEQKIQNHRHKDSLGTGPATSARHYQQCDTAWTPLVHRHTTQKTIPRY